MAQFVLKIEKLSHIMGPRASQDLRSPSPIMAPGTIKYGVTGVRLTRNHSQIGEQVLLLVLLINLINKGAFFYESLQVSILEGWNDVP